MDPLEFELRRQHERALWPWIVGALALIVIVALIGWILFLSRSNARRPATQDVPQTAMLTVLSGVTEVRLPTEAGTWIPASGSTQLAPGSHVRTGDTGRAEVVLSDGSVVRLNSSTEVALTSVPSAQQHRTVTELFFGEVWVRAVNLGTTGSFEVQTDGALLSSRSAAFSVRKRAGRLAAYALQHDLTVRFTGGATVVLREARKLDVSLTDPSALAAATLPAEPQDAGFLNSKWRNDNLTRDIAHLTGLLEALSGSARGDVQAALDHSSCLLDPTKCRGVIPQVTSVRASVSDGQAFTSISLADWDGRTLQLTWKRDGQVIRQTNLLPRAGDLVAQDQADATVAGTYTVEAQVDQGGMLSTEFIVGVSGMPSSLPSGSAPSSVPTGACQTPTSITICGLNQIYLDADANCEFEACRTCPASQRAVDTDSDGFRNRCEADPSAIVPSALPPSGTPPSSIITCVDPGSCPYGYRVNPVTRCSECQAAPASSVPPSDTPPSSEPPASTLPPPSVIPSTLCGNGVIDTGEQCDPPVEGGCDASCQLVF